MVSASYDGRVTRPSPLRQPGRRVVLGAVAGALGAGVAGCSASPDDPRPSPTPTVPEPRVDGPTPEDVAAVAEVLTTRAGALVAGDDGAYFGSAFGDDPSAQDRQVAVFVAARALGVSRLEVDDVRLETDASALPGEPALRATALWRYRLGHLDRADRTASVEVRVVRVEGRWLVVSEQPTGPGASAPWLALPGLTVRSTRHALVAGTVEIPRLAEYAAVVERAVPDLRRDWSRTPSRVLVLAPDTVGEADALLGRDGGAAGEVGATTEGPTDALGRATGDRVVLDPIAFGRLTRAGRDVVLTHELVHVAVRATVPGRTAAWLAEGYADHVGYQRADVAVDVLLAPLVAEVRAGRGPTDLPRLDSLEPSSGSIEVPYLAAWQAVELLVRRYGEAAVRRLVVAGAATGTDADAEAATDRALRTVLRTDRGTLVREWRTHLESLAR